MCAGRTGADRSDRRGGIAQPCAGVHGTKTLTHYAVGEPVGPKRAENKPDKALRQRCVLCVNTYRHSRLHQIDRSRSQSGSRTNSYDCMAIRINSGIAQGE